MGAGQVGQVVGDEGGLAGEELPRDAAQPVEVGPGSNVGPDAVELFRRHEPRRAADDVGVGGLHPLAERRCDAEVGEQRVAAGAGQQDVRRLDVEVGHAASVGVGQRPEEGVEDLPQPGPSRRLGERGQGASLGDLHHQVGAPGGQGAAVPRVERLVQLAVVEHGDHVRVVEPGDGLDLVREAAADELGLQRSPAGQELDGDGLARGLVARAPHLPHAAAAQERLQTEGSDHAARHPGASML